MGYQVLEHTADIGIRAEASSLEGVFEQAAYGLVDIIGVSRPADGERQRVELSADDLEGLLVEWLGEVLYLHDAKSAAITSVQVEEIRAGVLRGSIGTVPLGDEPVEGLQVKAITYHRLRIQRPDGGGWAAEVYLDV